MNKSIVIPELILQQNPLFWSGQGDVIVNLSRPNIFLGTGVATKNKLSEKIPFDSLGFLLSAEFIRQQIPDSHVFLLIADQHAWLANKLFENGSKKIANQQEIIFGRLISKLGISNWHIFKASELFPQAEPDSYENLETRDVFHFFHHRNTGIKIGWKSADKNDQHLTDEAHFDHNFDFDIKSIFIKPGVTFDSSKPFESPYICTSPSKRILLSKVENVAEKLNSRLIPDNQCQAVQNQLKRITILFEQVIGSLPVKTPVAKKVQLIIDRIFKK